jgi:3-hydroxymyristoyl/3-hydroxydecanoyl-(acyl carrier protein) dehydratase/acyl carrier protein
MSPEVGGLATQVPSDLNEGIVLDRIRAFVADAADCVVDQVGENDDIYEQLNVDSLGAVAIFIDVSHEFRVAEPATEEDYQSLNTPRKILEYVLRGQHQHEETETPLLPLRQNIPPDILAQLPYGEEFQFIDDVALHEKGHIITLRKWAAQDPIALAHFRNGPHLVPGVLLAEQVAQSALLLALLEDFVKDGERVLLSQLRCEFRTPVSVPAEVEADVRFRGTGHGHFGFTGISRASGTEVLRLKGLASKVKLPSA